VHELGLRLRSVDATVPTSEVVGDPVVDSLAPSGRSFSVEYVDGGTALLRDEVGREIARADVGERLEAPAYGFSFTVQAPPPSDVGPFALELVEASAAARFNVQANARDGTNIVDVFLTYGDQTRADDVLNALAEQLRGVGERRVRGQVASTIELTQQQLDSAQATRGQIAARLQAFQQSRDFISLSSQERRLVDDAERIDGQIAELEQLQTVLASIGERVTPESAPETDFAAIEASLPASASRQVTTLIAELRQGRSEIQQLVDQGLGEANPRLRSARAALGALAGEFVQAVNSRGELIEAELAGVRAERAQLLTEQARFPDLQAQMSQFQQELQQSDQLIAYLRGQLAEQQIRQAASQAYIEVIDPAVSAIDITPNGRLNILLGALLGLVLGVGAAFFLEYLDRTVRTSADIETLLGIPVLGIIPRLRRIDDEIEEQVRGRKTPMIVAMDPLDPAAEAYRNLRMNLMFMSTTEEPIKSILFSSPGPDEGKSTTALNFAVMLAQQGQRVLLIDADLRRPSLHRALDILREPGLTNLLVGDAETREAVRPNVLPNLDILPSGPFPPNPSELLNSRAMERLIDELGGKYAHVIIDCPPILAVTDAAILAAHVHGTVVVLRSGETEQRAAERAVDQLRRLGSRVFGAVLNEVVVSGADEDYYLQYFYHYQPSEESSGGRLRSGLAKAKFW